MSERSMAAIRKLEEARRYMIEEVFAPLRMVQHEDEASVTEPGKT